MKFNFLSLLTLFTVLWGYSQTKVTVPLASVNQIEVKNNTNDGFTLHLSLADLTLKNEQSVDGSFISVHNDLLNHIYTEGVPNIPVLTRLIEIPQRAQVTFEVISFDEQIIQLSDYGMTEKIIPAKRSQSKSESHLPFVFNESAYQTNDFLNKDIAKFVEAGQMRAVRLGNLEVYPIQYNPVQNTLRIINNLQIKVKFENADQSATKAIKSKYGSVNFQLPESNFLNSLHYESRELINQLPIHLVIVSDRMFQSQLTPFIAWKVKKGFKVTVAYTDVIGTTTTAIKSYLQGIYQGANPMSFVLLVGDVAQIPTFAGSAGSHYTDLRYFEYTGDDLPEVYYGRFSAQTTAQLQPQIDKTLMYEQFTMPDPSYLNQALLVAGDDASYEMTHANGQIYYGEQNYYNAAHQVVQNMYYQPLDNAATSTIIRNKISAGVGFANYTAHCSSSGWASPSFSTSNVNALTNANKYGMWIGNCCQSNTFYESECFGEAALRKANGGAIGYIGGSNNSYWDEDYWWGVGLTPSVIAQPTYTGSGRGAYDGYWHDLANEVNNTTTWYPTQGQMTVCGNIAVQASTSSLKQYYWEIYHLMGDPTITNFVGTPQPMTVTPNPSALMVGMTTLQVNAAPYAYVALSQNGVLFATALTNASGQADLTFASNILTVGTADLVVTAQNRIPYIGTITISPANEPYVSLNTFNTSNTPTYNQTTALHVKLENVAATGSGFDANGVVAVISSTSPYVSILDNTENFGQIIAGNQSLINNAYQVSFANNIPDQQVVSFNMVITDNAGHTWNTTFNLTVNAPAFTINNLTINDATGNNDGILDPGETANLIIQTTNSGHADVINTIGNITSMFSGLTINTATTSPVGLAMGASQNYTFNVTAAPTVPQGTPADIHYTVTGGNTSQYSKVKDFQVIIGFVPTYCDALGTTTTDEFISNVTFSSINNTSTQADGYTNYTNLVANVFLGQSYPISIVNGEHWSTDIISCWVDWDYDGLFETGNETIALTYTGTGSSGSGTGTATGTITVPTNAHVGNTRMRVRVQYGGTTSSCGNTSYGEVEDYTVMVQNPMGIDTTFANSILVYPNPTKGYFMLQLPDINSETTAEIYNLQGQKVYQTPINDVLTTIQLHQANGVYLVKIISGNKSAVKKLIINN